MLTQPCAILTQVSLKSDTERTEPEYSMASSSTRKEQVSFVLCICMYVCIHEKYKHEFYNLIKVWIFR